MPIAGRIVGASEAVRSRSALGLTILDLRELLKRGPPDMRTARRSVDGCTACVTSVAWL